MAIPQTRVRTSHALSIRANGQTVGLINSWGPTQSRTMTPIFEVGVDNSGNPIEYMPGNMSGLTISVNRYDTYPQRMEEVFGARDLTMLTRQAEPFDMFEIWSVPEKGQLERIASGANLSLASQSDVVFKQQERFMYRACWFTSLGRTLSSDDNRIVNVNATLVYTQKLKVQGPLGSTLDKISQLSF